MRTADQVFAKEFKDMMNGRRSITGNFNITNIPIPFMPSLITNLGKGEICLVKGIKEQFFEKLNNSEVQLINKSVLMKRQVLSDGSFREDKEGNYVYIQVPIKQGFIAVHSNKSIKLKNRILVNGVERKHIPTEGYKYIDYFELNGERRYIYTIPKENVYPLSLCALVITPNKHKSFFKGCKIALQNGYYLNLYIIPYKPGREYRGLRVLGVKTSTNFDTEVRQLLEYWMQIGVIFNLNLTALENQIGGEANLGIVDLVGTLGVEDYIRIENSLGYVPSIVENQG